MAEPHECALCGMSLRGSQDSVYEWKTRSVYCSEECKTLGEAEFEFDLHPRPKKEIEQ